MCLNVIKFWNRSVKAQGVVMSLNTEGVRLWVQKRISIAFGSVKYYGKSPQHLLINISWEYFQSKNKSKPESFCSIECLFEVLWLKMYEDLRCRKLRNCKSKFVSFTPQNKKCDTRNISVFKSYLLVNVVYSCHIIYKRHNIYFIKLLHWSFSI